ncbi:MAG: hypothetical protein M3270_07860 [Thermoproteota archaeon]|nr:hypothetical protein [Thermoproteota archaeon]
MGRVGKVVPRSAFSAEDNITMNASIPYSHGASARGIAPTRLKTVWK